MALGSLDRTVLVCEDDPSMVRIFQFLLRQQGIRSVVTAGNGEQVFPLAQQHKPSLILLDVMLPGKDGLSVLRDLKENEETRLIPVIVVSGKESREQVQQAMMAGAIDYVIKPFEPMELGSRIKNFLDTLNDFPTDASAEASPPSPGLGGLH
jgi:DNA-binding response OmpR family regulator